jgi:hypothetical protein
MKRNLLRSSLLLALTGAFLSTSLSVEATNPSAKLKIELKNSRTFIQNRKVAKASRVLLPLRSKAAAADSVAVPVADAKYSYPGVTPFQGYANYLSFSNLNVDYLQSPKDSIAFYADQSLNSPTAYLWSVPGVMPAAAETQDLEVTYATNGSYAFPTLTTTTSNGQSSYTAVGSLKVGGKSEIASFNSLALDSTYSPYDGQWLDDKGFISGSNGWDDLAFGNLFFLGQDTATVSSVSVYIRANPTAANKDNKVKLTLYETGEDANGYFLPTGKALASAELKVSEMMPGSSSITGIKYNSGAEVMGLADFKFASPVKVSSLFFAAVENIGNNLVAGDSLCIMMNTLDAYPTDSFTTIGSNSSWSLSDNGAGGHEWYGLYYYLDFNPVLMICPVVNFGGIDTGIAPTKYMKSAVIVRSAKGFTVLGGSEGESVSAFSLTGQRVLYSKVTSQRQTFSGLNAGAYIVKVGSATQKVLIY